MRQTCSSASQKLHVEPFIFFPQVGLPQSLSCLQAFGGGALGSVVAIMAPFGAQMPSGRFSSLMQR